MTSRQIDSATVREALTLAAELPNGHLLDHVERVTEWARASPEAVAAMTVVLAAMVEDGGLARLCLMAGLEPEARTAAVREAHRLHSRGVRSPWVVDGERAYQREKKRRLRTAERPTREVA